MWVEDIITGRWVRVPRKTKKRAKKNNLIITGRLSKKMWTSVSKI